MQQVQMPQTHMAPGQPQMACGLQNTTQVQGQLASQANFCGPRWPNQLDPDNEAPPGDYGDFQNSPIDTRPRAKTSPNGYNDVFPQRCHTDPCNSTRAGNFGGGYGDARQAGKHRSQSDNVNCGSESTCPTTSADMSDYGNGYCNDFITGNYSTARRRSNPGTPNFQPW